MVKLYNPQDIQAQVVALDALQLSALSLPSDVTTLRVGDDLVLVHADGTETIMENFFKNKLEEDDFEVIEGADGLLAQATDGAADGGFAGTGFSFSTVAAAAVGVAGLGIAIRNSGSSSKKGVKIYTEMPDNGTIDDTHVILNGPGVDFKLSDAAQQVLIKGAKSVKAGDGDDIITGGADADTINGDAGNDVITGGAGDDTIDGDVGDDNIDGDVGNDIIDGGAGDDTITGGEGVDTITGGEGVDTITGGAGDDTITGGEGVDTITGGAGADAIDLVETTRVTDTVVFEATANGLDTIADFTAGAGGDVLDFSAFFASGGVAVNPASNKVDADALPASGTPPADGMVLRLSDADTDDAAAVGALFNGAGYTLEVDGKAVVLSDDTNSADGVKVWVVTRASGAAAVAEQYATLSAADDGAEAALLAAFTEANFLI